MAGVWKRDGTVAVTNGNKKVTGTGTTFADTKNGVAKGHLFCITSGTSVDFYEVDYVVSNTELYLVQAYRGVTATGKAYEIITTFSDSVPEFARRLTATLSAYQQQSDAFQALLTSTATTVEVTAPDGTKQTLIPWKRVTSEGEGQAARAKTEADKAAASAALAGDIVAASALPLPDVWAPLTDSLRLFTGYGRDVVVGSDVVARMVNFSRSTTATYIGKDGQLKTAAANEPRFEKEGLLLEGQSQNLVVYSEGATFFTANASFQTLTNNVSGVLPMTGQRISFATNNGETNANLIQTSLTLTGGQTYTYSTHLKVEAGDTSAPENCIGIYAANGVNIGDRAVIRKTGDGIYRVSVPFTVSGTGSQTVFIRFNRIGLPSAVWTAVVGGVQVENLPFASSYIPTNGAAVTRAADQAWLPAAGNRFISGMYAVACEFDLLGRVPGVGFTRLVDFDNSGGADRQHLSLSDGGQLQCVLGTGFVAGVAGKLAGRAAMRMNNFTLNVMLDGVAGSPVTVSSFGSSANNRIVLMNTNIFNIATYGHIRNLRMWSKHPISNEQLRTAV
ncbi:phage head spike fiber domain-containing protein [Aeromonas sp. Y318-3]|uniref:phage head spike fiber domain-containing protein n=1 Tax=Aeromonas sp. Y318-3 TaxID=2990509 RepID=UPI0022E5FA62|nr:hypothetical protein [Aeromonas sp. Y318-3]